MTFLTKLKTLFSFKKAKTELASEIRTPSVEEKAHYSFSFDGNKKFKSQEEMIPEVFELLDRLKKGESTTLNDIAVYFKYFENGYQLKYPFFKLKREFSENCLFSIESTKVFFEDENKIKVFHLVLKEEITGLRVTIEAPTSFFVEFAEQVPPPVLP